MAYATSNPPQKTSSGIGNGVTVWAYSSADVNATVVGAGYFSNGDALGMKVGDIVLIGDTATPLGTIAVVSAVTAGGAATVTGA